MKKSKTVWDHEELIGDNEDAFSYWRKLFHIFSSTNFAHVNLYGRSKVAMGMNGKRIRVKYVDSSFFGCNT